MIIEIIFWISIFAILHTYLLYPLLLRILAKGKEDSIWVYSKNDDIPDVSIIMSLFNEEEVIKAKIESLLRSTYDKSKIEIIIGSDASTDQTNEIVRTFENEYPKIFRFSEFQTRQGKGNIINQLYEKAKGEILILTDANVIFEETTIFELVKHFKNPKIGIVDSQMINKGISKKGISIQEKTYISNEVKVKSREGRIWGTMMGPFGGCYAIRKELYTKVPPNYLVDDFFINMSVLAKGKQSINNLHAKVYEDVSNNLADEFRRKVRISTGNFQNLRTFAYLLLPLNKGLSFSFLSHKVLRWLGPFFLLIAFICNLLLSKHALYQTLLIIYSLTFLIPIIDFIFRRLNIHVVAFRFFTHFYSMNLALMIGFYKYLKGVKSNVWQPTKRFQTR